MHVAAVIALAVVLCSHAACAGGGTPMRVVDTLRVAAYGRTGGGSAGSAPHQPLGSYPEQTPRVHKAPYAGPPALRNLTGVCTSFVSSTYDYRACLFDNITQHDLVNTWSPYHGILGVYAGWEIVNETFVTVLYQNGDPCRGFFRSVNVTLKCGAELKAVSATEPSVCKYAMTVETPLLCHADMNVTTVLSPAAVRKLRRYQDELYDEEITEQGYQHRVNKLYQAAGLLPAEKAEPYVKSTTTTTTTTTTTKKKDEPLHLKADARTHLQQDSHAAPAKDSAELDKCQEELSKTKTELKQKAALAHEYRLAMLEMGVAEDDLDALDMAVLADVNGELVSNFGQDDVHAENHDRFAGNAMADWVEE